MEQFYRCGKPNGGRWQDKQEFHWIAAVEGNDVLKTNIYEIKKEMVKRSRFKFIIRLHM